MTEDSSFDTADFEEAKADNSAEEDEEDETEDEEQEGFPEDLFPLYRDEISLIEKCEQFARNLLKRSDLTPEQIVAVGYLLHALRRLPLPTKDVSVSVSLKWSNPDGYTLQTLYLSESALRFDSAGWEQGDFGGDSFGRSVLDMEVGWRDEASNSHAAYEWITSLCDEAGREGCTVEVENSSDETPDWDEGESERKDWERLPSLDG